MLYAAATWPSLSVPQKKQLDIRNYSPLRKAVDGSWSTKRKERPLGWREDLVLAQGPSFEVALAVARVRFLARLGNAPGNAGRSFAGCKHSLASSGGEQLMRPADCHRAAARPTPNPIN